MAFRLGNNAQEMASNQPASAATAFNLAGAETGRQTILAAIGDDNSATFIAQEVDANNNPSGAWQVFVGTVNDATPDTLSQDSIIASSNAGSAVDWSALSAPLITLVAEESRLARRTATIALAGESSYDIPCRAGCAQLVILDGVDLSNDQVDIYLRVSTDGTTFDAGASDYNYSVAILTTSWSHVFADGTQIITGNAQYGNGGDGEEISGWMWIFSANDAGTMTRIVGEFETQSYLAGPRTFKFRGQRLAAQADVEVRILPSAGTFSAGRITVFEFPLS